MVNWSMRGEGWVNKTRGACTGEGWVNKTRGACAGGG
ncbi:hypothetical protein GBAR_LOCUS10908 [Geodia barretti]|uniref:Uncharacterized protein n=1 Tax=Geodia barretti TaxID=519541 RepID=A0AA35RVN8_GEOBA|nr:hypothetical protein GBAR_LOCUS10908 [Geodia barretti]